MKRTSKGLGWTKKNWKSCALRSAGSIGIALYKLKAHKPIYDAEREAKNIEALSSLIEDVSSRPDFIRWYQLLMDISKKLQSKLIQGETK